MKNLLTKSAVLILSLGALLTVGLNANAAATTQAKTRTTGNTTKVTNYAKDGKTVAGYVIKTVDPTFGNVTVTHEDVNRNVTYTYVTKKGRPTNIRPVNHFSNDRSQANLAVNPY